MYQYVEVQYVDTNLQCIQQLLSKSNKDKYIIMEVFVFLV